MPEIDNFHESWGPASRSNPDIAKLIEDTGSDIQAEDDMASIFGRNAIEKSVDTAFRAFVSRPGTQYTHSPGIFLRAGRGPTLERALVADGQLMFATVLQCAFLCSVHERRSLAACLGHILDYRWDDHPPGLTRPLTPSHEYIVGFLRACEEQGCRQWFILDEVARELGFSEHGHSGPIDYHILQGVCLTLPTLQTQNDMQVHIRTRNGVCALATWFSRLLGFVVEITRRQGDNKDCQPSIVRLGPTGRRVCVKIDTVSEERPCVMLKGHDQLTEVKDPAILAELGATYKGNPDMLRIGRLQNEHRIDQDGKIFQQEAMKTFLGTNSNSSLDKKVHGVTRRPVRGLGKKVLGWTATNFAGAAGRQGRGEWYATLKYVTILFALDVAVHLRKFGVRLLPDKSVAANDILKRVNDGSNDNEGLPLGGGHMSPVPHWHVIDAARLIFDDEHISGGSYNQTYQSALDMYRIDKTSLGLAKTLSVLLLTFANVTRVDSCAELLLNLDFRLLNDQAFARRVQAWDGNSSIPVQEHDWFEIVAKLLVGRSEVVDAKTLDSITLLSDHGWSIYRPVINLRRDPSDTDALGKFCVCLGVPYHNGIQKRRIEDVTTTPLSRRSHYSPNYLSYLSGSTILPSFQGQFSYVSEDCAVGKESFIVGETITHEVEFQKFRACRRTGSRELSRALWPARKTTGCECREKLLPPTFKLPPGCGALVVRCDDDFETCADNLILCLTGGNSIARWRALIADHGDANVLLRGKDCCLTCAMEQASKLPRKCHLIL